MTRRTLLASVLAFWIIFSAVGVGMDVRADVPGQSSVTYTVSPTQPVVGQPATVTAMLTVPPGAGALVAFIPITATAEKTGQMLSMTANFVPGSPSVYSTTLTFPAPGVWHVASPNLSGVTGNDLSVTVVPPLGMPLQINIAFTTDPVQPIVGQPTTINVRVFAVGGPGTIALVRTFSISAVSNVDGTVISATATALPNGPGGMYSASMTFPAAGIWHIATDNFKGAPGNTFDVTVIDAPPSDLSACRAADLSADAQWQGAAGSRIGTVTVTNNGPGACLLPAYPAVQIENAQGRIAPTENATFTDASDMGGDIVLQPGQQAATDVRWSNECPQATASDMFLLRVTLPDSNGSLTVPTSVPPCLGDTQPSHLSQQPFTLRGDAARVVRDYFMAINRRDYRAAYALFGVAMQQNQSSGDFAAGFAMTQQDDLHIRTITQNGDQSVVTITLDARETNGDTQRYIGTYTIGSENGALKIIAASIVLM